MNLILIERSECDPGGAVGLRGERAAHVKSVLKARPGQSLRVGLLDGPLGVAVVRSVADAEVWLDCAFEAHIPRRPPIDLLLALPRPKLMRRLWAQLAAMGVGRVALTNAARVERNYFDAHVLAPDRYVPLLMEGLQQARDTRLPLVSVHRQFRKLVEDELDSLSDAPTRLMGDPGGTADAALLGIDGRRRGNGRVLLAVGPEGGWNAFERELLRAHGFATVTLGSRTLRTDTACIALLAVLQAALRASSM